MWPYPMYNFPPIYILFSTRSRSVYDLKQKPTGNQAYFSSVHVLSSIDVHDSRLAACIPHAAKK